MKKFWLISLCALLVIAASLGWNAPLRAAVVAIAILVLIDVAKTVWRWNHADN